LSCQNYKKNTNNLNLEITIQEIIAEKKIKPIGQPELFIFYNIMYGTEKFPKIEHHECDELFDGR